MNTLSVAMQTRYFGRKEEEKQNPYMGFVSFQHFRDEALYSDIIVRPESKMTETENVECYPIPEYVPQNGRSEGFYPDTTIAYIRILWKEFEPVQGEYHYEVIEDVLNRAKACGQTVMFRLMPHSTRACDDVPDWLKEIIDCPERPDGERVKDSPRDPRYLEYFGAAIRKIGERFDEDSTLDMVDICMPGAWGEGHRLDTYTEEELKQWIDLFTGAFRKTWLFGQIRNPELINYANETRPVGWRGDGIGEENHMHTIYPIRVEQVSELWKTAPASFEAYFWLGEWQRKGWDIDWIISQTLEWHISSFNAKSLPIPDEWQDKIRYWNSRMGYHFGVDYFRYPESVERAEGACFELAIENTGVAPMYHAHSLMLRLVNEQACYTFDTGIDVRSWLPGKHVEHIQISLPAEMKAGHYQIEIGIGAEDDPIIYFATDAPRNGRHYVVGETEVEDKS